MTDLKMYICAAIPDGLSEKESGARRVARCIKATDERSARRKILMQFLEEYPGAQDAAYRFLICEDGPGMPRPGLDSWDEEFLYENDWNEKLGHPVKRERVAVNFEKLSGIMKIAVLVQYDRTDVTAEELPAALALTENADSFDGHLVDAINRTPEIASMYPERIIYAIGWVRAKCAPEAKWPEIKKELLNWKKRRDGENKPSSAPTSVVDIARERAAREKLDVSPINLQDDDSLKRNIALGLVARAMDFDILSPPAGIVNRARDIIKLKEKPFPAWYDVMSKTPDIHQYSGVQIIFSVKTAAEDIDKTPGAILSHVNRTFTETDHQNPSAEMLAIACGTVKTKEDVNHDETEQSAAGAADTLDSATPEAGAVEQKRNGNDAATGTLEATPSVERTGPFYFVFADGEKFGRANKMSGLQKALAEGCTEISQEEYQARKNGTFSPQAALTPAGNEPDNGNAHDPEQGEMIDRVPEETVSVNHPIRDEFILRADELEKELSDGDNISLWKSVMRTNPRYTKDMTDLGFGGTSINAEYMVMRATEAFGPVGKGWGWHILEDKMIEGAPLSEKIFEGNKFVGSRTLRDADGTLLFELNHYMRICLWYIKDGERFEVENFGSTTYRKITKHGIYCDPEVHKKTLTDGIKKCLSMLGFSADVWLGLYDDAEYRAESLLEFGIKDASEKADDSARIREELDERFKANVETMRKAVSPNEVSKIASTLTRTIGVHLKSAREINDTAYVKYLEGRLHRLEEVKAEFLKNMEEKA